MMSDHIRGEFLQIEHTDVEVEMCVAGVMEVFSTANTAVWLYPQRYSSFNHIVRDEDNDTCSRWFSPTQGALDELHEAGVTHVYPPYPGHYVKLGFWVSEMAYFDLELIDIAETGEIPPSEVEGE